MTRRTQDKEIEILIRARYPLLYLVSWEEQRVLDMLRHLARTLGKELYTWSRTEGFVSGDQVAEADSGEVAAALRFVERSERQALFVLKDLHPELKEPLVVRRLRDLVGGLKASTKTLILLSPVLQVPPELEKDLTVIDYDLPGPEELRRLLRGAVQASRGGRYLVELEAHDEERLVQAALGMTLGEAENAFARAIAIDGKLDPSDVEVILEEKKHIIARSRLLEFIEVEEDLGGVGGLELLKEWLRKRGRAFGKEARDFGLPEPRGLLLLGVQGCGKSLVCKAVAGAWRLPLLRLDMGTLFSSFVGQSEENMRRAIKVAEAVSPCILWLDEIEKALAGTESSRYSDAGTTARVFSTFLTWLQEKTRPVFVAATANRIRLLPPELLRKGRFDEMFFVDLPRPDERAEILSIHLRKKGRDPARFPVEKLVGRAEGYSGAELEQAVIEGLYEAFDEGRELAPEHVERALAASVPLSRTMEEDLEELRAWARVRARPASARGGRS